MSGKPRRQKVTNACDACKARKYKCTGTKPCEYCQIRHIVCAYTAIDRRTTKKSKPSTGNPLHLLTKVVFANSQPPPHFQSILPSTEPQINGSHQGMGVVSSIEALHAPETLGNRIIRETPKRNGVVSRLGKDTFSPLLIDSVGHLRYMGESSPLALLSVCRQFFRSAFGESKFTSDQELSHIIDKTSYVLAAWVNVPLPPKPVCMQLVDLFHVNVNSSLYVMDKSYLIEGIVDPVYDRPLETKRNKFCLLYLILGLAMLLQETTFMTINIGSAKSSDYFDHGYNMLRQTIEDGSLWLTEAYYVVFFYFQTMCKCSTSWLCLGIAIRNAQALGLHRRSINNKFILSGISKHRRLLWRSLYVSDRACLTLLGRPLQINDCDWDDYDDVSWMNPDDDKASLLVEMSKVARLNGKIVQDLYSGSSFNVFRVEELANELREWSLNMPKNRRVDVLIKDASVIAKNGTSYALLTPHLSQLYGICLLCKPFFLFVIHSHQNNLPVNFHKYGYFNSCVKSAVLIIQLVSVFLENESIHYQADLYVIFNYCFMSALVVGMTISLLATIRLSQEFDSSSLMNSLLDADKVLACYSIFNDISKRYHQIITLMIDAIRASDNAFHNAGRLVIRRPAPNYDPLYGIQEFQTGFGPPSLGNSLVLVDDAFNTFFLDLGSHDLFYSAD